MHSMFFCVHFEVLNRIAILLIGTYHIGYYLLHTFCFMHGLFTYEIKEGCVSSSFE